MLPLQFVADWLTQGYWLFGLEAHFRQKQNEWIRCKSQSLVEIVLRMEELLSHIDNLEETLQGVSTSHPSLALLCFAIQRDLGLSQHMALESTRYKKEIDTLSKASFGELSKYGHLTKFGGYSIPVRHFDGVRQGHLHYFENCSLSLKLDSITYPLDRPKQNLDDALIFAASRGFYLKAFLGDENRQ